MKRFFKRKNRQQEGGSDAGSSAATPSNKLMSKTTPPGDANPATASAPSNPSSQSLTARTDSHVTRNDSKRRSDLSSPSPMAQQRKSPSKAPVSGAAKPVPPPASKPLRQDPTKKDTNGAAKAALPKTPATAPSSSVDAARKALKDQEKGSYKGVSESFKKGLSVSQRYGVGEASEEQTSADKNQLGKLGDAYDSIPLLEQTKLPRGGISMETKAVGRVQVRKCVSMDPAWPAAVSLCGGIFLTN